MHLVQIIRWAQPFLIFADCIPRLLPEGVRLSADSADHRVEPKIDSFFCVFKLSNQLQRSDYQPINSLAKPYTGSLTLLQEPPITRCNVDVDEKSENTNRHKGEAAMRKVARKLASGRSRRITLSSWCDNPSRTKSWHLDNFPCR